MATTLFDNKPYDPEKEKRKKIRIASAILVLLIVAGLGWYFRYWQYEHRVDLLFRAIEAKDFDKAYGIWFNDPDWKQHPERYASYTSGQFYLDWGPGGEWGLIKTHKVIGTAKPPGKGDGTGVIVGIIVNGRAEQCHVWMEKKDKTMHFSPY